MNLLKAEVRHVGESSYVIATLNTLSIGTEIYLQFLIFGFMLTCYVLLHYGWSICNIFTIWALVITFLLFMNFLYVFS